MVSLSSFPYHLEPNVAFRKKKSAHIPPVGRMMGDIGLPSGLRELIMPGPTIGDMITWTTWDLQVVGTN
jgi:hypothetical protein